MPSTETEREPGNRVAAGFAAADNHGMDFRDQFVKEALDQAVAPYRPEKNLGSRILRITTVAVLALVAVLVVAEGILNRPPPRPAPPSATHRPVTVEIVPAPRDAAAR